MEHVHAAGLVYRDVKPDNFLLRLNKPASPPEGGPSLELTVIDFGMAKPYIDAKTGKHVPFRERRSLSGTARYMSINSHMGREQSRRDDLESLGHVFFYFARGSLPWQGLKAPSHRDKCERIAHVKQSTTLGELCQRPPADSLATGEEAEIPFEFGQYLAYCRNLAFDERPDYDRCRQFFRRCCPSGRPLAEVADFDVGALRREYMVKYTGQPSVDVLMTPERSRRVVISGPAQRGEDGGPMPRRRSWWRRLLCLSSGEHA